MSTAQDLPVPLPSAATDAALAPVPSPLLDAPFDAPPHLRLVPTGPAIELDFEAAVRSVRTRLHRYATRRLGDEHEAEELVQEALLRAYAHRDTLKTEEDLAAWATVVTGRLVIDRLRVRNRSVSVAEVPEGRIGRDTADVVVGRDEARTALDALDAMPARQAALLWAREVEGASYEELCVRFGMSEPAVRSILTRARKSLRKEYASRGGTLPVAGLAVLAPWLGGLTWAHRAREMAHRLTTVPAALATIGITALGGLVLSPFGGAHSPTTIQPGTAVVTQVATAPTAVRTTVSAPSRAIVRHARPAVPAATDSRRVLDVTDQLPCDSAYPVQRADCASPDKGAFIEVAPGLPANPVVHRQLGVTISDYDCAKWVANPAIACKPGGADR